VNGRSDNQSEALEPAGAGPCAFVDENAAAYALGGLDLADRGVIDQHLLWCARCREIVAASDAVTARLPFLAPPVPGPSPAVRAALLERVQTDRDAPVESAPLAARASQPAMTRRVVARPAPPPPARWRSWVPAALVAPLAIALIVALAWANSLQNTIDEQEADLAAEAPSMANGGIQLFAMEPQCSDCTGGGRVGVNADSGVGMVVAWGFDPSRKHSVWCKDGKGDAKWVSSLDVNQDGAAIQTFAFPTNASDYTEVFVADDNGSVAYMSTITTPRTGDEQDQGGDATPAPDASA
jgi:hypothetical protein